MARSRDGLKVLLYSGGMDSWLIDRLWRPDIRLYFPMSTRYGDQELDRISDTRDDVELDWKLYDLGELEREDSIIPLRNLYMVMMAANYGDVIQLGATYGDRVLDKSPEFATMTTNLLTFLYQAQHWTEARTIEVRVDFKDRTKVELVREFKDQGGDLEEAWNGSFSCYLPTNDEICWQCKPCVRKVIAFLLNGYTPDPYMVDRLTRPAINNLVEQIQAGTYDRGRENQDIIQAAEYLGWKSFPIP